MRTSTMSKKALTEQANGLVEQVTPHVEAARDRLVNDYLPVAQELLAEARDAALEVAKEARDATVEAATEAEKSTRKSRRKAAKAARSRTRQLMMAAAAAAPVTAPLAEKVADTVQPRPRRTKRVLLLLGLAGLGVFVFKKVRDGGSTTASYQPPRPAPAPAHSATTPVASTPPTTPSATSAGTPEPDATSDEGGAFLDEALADATEEPHKVTTPDQPLEVTEVDGGPGAKKA